MSDELETDKEKLESTTITFRIKAREKEAMQIVANEVANGNITKLIKFAVDHYIADQYGSLEYIRERGNDLHKYYRDMMRNLAQSEDPAVIEAKWEEVKPRTMMMFVQEFERRMKQLQDELNMKLEHLLSYHIQFY
jgi:hypothetical protein